jgi:predicted house-cleaning noncanonical NTP pyrophosphatase (MazG superfamily)
MSDPLQELYNKIFEEATEYMKEHEVQAVAATYMAIAMRLYKTNLTDEGFLQMIRTVMESEVEPYETKKVLH